MEQQKCNCREIQIGNFLFKTRLLDPLNLKSNEGCSSYLRLSCCRYPSLSAFTRRPDAPRLRATLGVFNRISTQSNTPQSKLSGSDPPPRGALGIHPAASTGLKKVNYDQLDKLLNISGLQKTKNECTTEEAHQNFMKLYPKIFIERKPILPGIPTKRTNGVHTCEFDNVNEFGKNSHNISLYLNKIKIPQTVHIGLPEYAEKMIILSKILKKIPVLRSPEEHETVYKTLKLIPDINDQLSDEELRELMACIVREYWVKGSTVDGSQGFYAILRGSARPQTKYYKKLLGGNFVSSSVLLCPQSSVRLTDSTSQILLGVGSCFGTLIPLPTRLQLDALSIITEENCDILKISSTEYLRIKEELAKRERLAKEELIRGSPFYQNWPLIFIFQLTAHLKWKKFPKGHVLLKVGEISKYVGFIKSGYCNAFRTIPALLKLPLGKMTKRTRQVLIGKLHPRQSFGEVSILFQIPSTYTLEAATPVELGLIDASDISGLDPVIRMLLVQTVKPSFENTTKDSLKLDYIKKEIEAEWRNTKDMAVNDVLFYSGISPGIGKWVHKHIRFERGEKEHGENLHIAIYKKPM